MKRENVKMEQSEMEHKMYTCRIEQWNDRKQNEKNAMKHKMALCNEMERNTALHFNKVECSAMKSIKMTRRMKRNGMEQSSTDAHGNLWPQNETVRSALAAPQTIYAWHKVGLNRSE